MAFLLGGLLMLAEAAAPVPPPVKVTAQQLFDQATDDVAAGRPADAVRKFETLEKGAKNPGVIAAIRVRKGVALIDLGRLDEGEESIRAGLPGIADNAGLRGDRLNARLALAGSALARLDFDGAKREGIEALTQADDPTSRARVLLLLARATMFDPGDDSVRYADEALAIAVKLPDIPKKMLANVRTVRARALLNHGQKEAAYAELKTALAQQGGLSLKVSAADIATRSDLAIAALLNGQKDSAREYLAYTGAGRTDKTPFTSAVDLDLPACGGEEGLTPEDVAIVEFGVAADGSVVSTAPVYSSKLGAAPAVFARTVAGWSWRPEAVKDIPLLFRMMARVELRCTTTTERPSIMRPLAVAQIQWLQARRVPIFRSSGAVGPALAAGRTELARLRGAGGGLPLVPVLMDIGANPAAFPEERDAWLSEASQLMQVAGAPIGAAIYPQLLLIQNRRSSWSAAGVDQSRAALRALLTQKAVTDDPALSATIRLLIAEPAYRSVNAAEAEKLLRDVAQDRRLPEDDPLKVGALVRLASIQANSGRVADARSSYQASGLSAQQCALADAKPALSRRAASSSDFPLEAMRWGFEGWARIEYDIGADGRTSNGRAVIAYPPFVFRDAAVGIAKDLRYTTSYRPGEAAGCTGEQQNIQFQIPG